MSDFVEDLGNRLADVGDCLWAQLWWWQFWLVLIVTLIIKHKILLPRLERHYKQTHAARVQIRKRRLRDTLNDPVLALQLEEQLLKRRDIQGDRSKMLQAKEQIQQLAEDNSSSPEEDDDKGNTKGHEKVDAANAMLGATIGLSILLFLSSQSMVWGEGWDVGVFDSYVLSGSTSMSHTVMLQQEAVPMSHSLSLSQAGRKHYVSSSIARLESAENYAARRNSLVQAQRGAGRRQLRVQDTAQVYHDACGMYGPILCSMIFCLVHLAHSYKLVRDASGKSRRKRKPTPGPEREPEDKSEVHEPLLSSSNHEKEAVEEP